MTERFNVSGALLVKLFGRPGDEERRRSRGQAGRVRDIGVTAGDVRPGVLHRADAGRLAGHRAGLRRRRRARRSTARSTSAPLVALTGLLGRLYGPLTALSNVQVDVMTALVSLRPGLRGARPAADDRRQAGRRRRCRAGRPTVEFDDVASATRRADEVSLASLESVAVLDQAPTAAGAARRLLHVPSPGSWSRSSARPAPARRRSPQLVARLYDVTAGAVRVGGHDVRDVTLESLRDVVGVVTQDAHMFHDTIRANLLYARPGRHRRRARRRRCRAAQIGDLVALAARRARHRRRRPRLPAVRRREAAARDRPAAAQGARRRRPRRGDRPPRLRVRGRGPAGARRRRSTGRTSLVIAHRLSTVRDADQILVVDDGRIVERGRHDELLAAGGLYAELYRTQFENQATSPSAEVTGALDLASRPRSRGSSRRRPGSSRR